MGHLTRSTPEQKKKVNEIHIQIHDTKSQMWMAMSTMHDILNASKCLFSNAIFGIFSIFFAKTSLNCGFSLGIPYF